MRRPSYRVAPQPERLARRTRAIVAPDGKVRRVRGSDIDNTLRRWCEADMGPRSRFGRCRAMGFLEYEGKHYCGGHWPPGEEKRRLARGGKRVSA